MRILLKKRRNFYKKHVPKMSKQRAHPDSVSLLAFFQHEINLVLHVSGFLEMHIQIFYRSAVFSRRTVGHQIIPQPGGDATIPLSFR